MEKQAIPKASNEVPVLKKNTTVPYKTIPETVTPNKTSEKTPQKKPRYYQPGKESLGGLIKKTLPKSLIPTKRVASIMAYIFLGVIVMALFQFPLGELMAGRTDISIFIGYPLPFLEFKLLDNEGSPALPINLFIDILVYLLLAYILDIVISLIINNPKLKSKKERREMGLPQVFKSKKPTLVETATKKVLGKNLQKKKINN